MPAQLNTRRAPPRSPSPPSPVFSSPRVRLVPRGSYRSRRLARSPSPESESESESRDGDEATTSEEDSPPLVAPTPRYLARPRFINAFSPTSSRRSEEAGYSRAPGLLPPLPIYDPLSARRGLVNSYRDQINTRGVLADGEKES
jgi:hypothetical protein